MRSVSAVAILSGPVVLSGYLVGALVATWFHPDSSGEGDASDSGDVASHGRPSDWLLEAFVTLTISTAAWIAIKAVSPGSNFSRVGYFSNQVLSAWQSVALWTGLAVVVGLCAPVFRQFRGSAGLAPAAALLAVHFPWFLFAAGGAGVVAFALSRSTRIARIVAIAMLLPTAWLGWVLEWLPAWGMPAGPEATIWTMVLSLVLGIRWWSDRPAGAAW